jgi:hypothetical protein
VKRLSINTAFGVLILLSRFIPAQAQVPLQYHGGPVLSAFAIYPLYYGNWDAADISAQQNYLISLAAYMSGQSAPAGQQPMMKQYGVNQVSVAPYATSGILNVPNQPDPGSGGSDPCSSATCLWQGDVRYIIQANQASGRLPAYGGAALIIVFPAHGIGLHGCNGCGYHHSESTSAFWAVVPEDAGAFGELNATDGFQLVTAHEVFEASANPSINNSPAWDEAIDQCDNNYAITPPYLAIRIPPATDNHGGRSMQLGRWLHASGRNSGLWLAVLGLPQRV